MTRDEQRVAIIEAMATGTARLRGYNLEFMAQWFRDALILEAAAAFDSLHGLARVCPVEATEEMIAAAPPFIPTHHCRQAFVAMSAAGDLTNPPEGKP